MVNHIKETVNPRIVKEEYDKTWWMGNSSGKFSIQSSWNIIRNRKEEHESYEIILGKGILF